MYYSLAYCKNSVDGQWYCFDDSEVQQLSESEVCKQTAYILFYQRRTAIPSWSANSSVAGEPCWPWPGLALTCLPWLVCPSGEFSTQLCLNPHSCVPELSEACLSLWLGVRGHGNIPALLLRQFWQGDGGAPVPQRVTAQSCPCAGHQIVTRSFPVAALSVPRRCP